MKYTLQYPITHAGYSPALLAADGMRKVVVAAESAGFDSIAFTEHPAPSQKWMAGGGHESFDPLTALALCAGVTSTIRLQTYLLVLPYRNPFLAAKQAATLHVLSGGRLILSVGTGYLRSEFLALGVEFEERNALFDEALEVIRRSWSEDDVVYEGLHFKALGQTQRPRPPEPGPAIWIGGNGKAARRRAARHGSGWTPLLIAPEMAKTTRTAPLRSTADLARGWRICANSPQQKGATVAGSTSRSNGARAPPLLQSLITSSNGSTSSPLPVRPAWWSTHPVTMWSGPSN